MKRTIMKFASAVLLSAILTNGWLVPGPEETMQMAAVSLPTAAPQRAAKEKERAVPATQEENPTQGGTTAEAAASVNWQTPEPVKNIADELGFIIQAPEPPEKPAPAEEHSASRQPAPTAATIPPLGFVIQAPEPPTYTPESEPTEPPTKQPVPQPTPANPIDPIPEPTELPAAPAPEVGPTENHALTPEQPEESVQQGYAICSCGATVSPEKLIPHMKAHAMAGESHGYVAY